MPERTNACILEQVLIESWCMGEAVETALERSTWTDPCYGRRRLNENG